MNNWLKNNLQSSFLGLLGLGITILWFYLQQTQEEGTYPIYLVALLWVLLLIFFLWIGNLFIYHFIRNKFPWNSSFKNHFFLQLLLSLFYSLICINGIYFLTKNFFTELPPSRNQLILLNLYGIIFLIPVISIQLVLLFSRKWKTAVVEQEKLEKEQVQSELVTLKSHLSPHFMFNSLNILSSLIEPKNDKAQNFLTCFAEVYRYVLKNRDKELIALREELTFLESYRYLLHSRFSDSLNIRIEVPSKFQDYRLPPLALQMLVENAIKHNELSETNPLHIRINTTNSPTLVIQNNLKIRKIPPQEKTGFGLENIRRRYYLIARKDITIQASPYLFKVILPLLTK